jgi:hypothetical protein
MKRLMAMTQYDYMHENLVVEKGHNRRADWVSINSSKPSKVVSGVQATRE